MEKVTTSINRHVLKYGLILGIISVINGVILYAVDSYTNQSRVNTIISIIILISVTTYGIYTYKSANNGFLRLNEALKTGIGIAFIGGVIGVIWHILITSVIEPDIVNQTINNQQDKMITRDPNMSQEQINQSMEVIKKFNSPFITSLFALIWNLFAGFLISLIGGAIMQKKRDVF